MEGTYHFRVAGGVVDVIEVHKVDRASTIVPRVVRLARYRESGG
jgi:hypothetical protein